MTEGGNSAVVDFVVQGCTRWSGGQCQGMVPLGLTFTALLKQGPAVASWDFGDNTASQSGTVVVHTYEKPGIYDVILTVGQGSGTVSEQKTGWIKVSEASPGAPCKSDAVCSSKKCICIGATCPFPLDTGLCYKSCEKSSQCSSGTDLACVDLSGGSINSKEPWRAHLCLPTCANDSDCTRSGFNCRLAPGTGGWRKVCMPSFPYFIGATCTGGSGKLDSGLCLGGKCLAVGAGGYCSAACTAGTCPEGARCVTFNKDSSDPLCLLKCDGSNCSLDPLLACELPAKKGQYGFTVVGSADPAGTQYCAPKFCLADKDCGLTGKCVLNYCSPAKP